MGAVPAASRGVVLGPVVRSGPVVPAGELLLGELNCVACHAADAAVLARVSPRQAPVLADVGARVTPQYLRAFLSDPRAAKPGTPMPDLLRGLDAGAKSAAVDALVQFLGSLTGTNVPVPAGYSPHLVEQGKVLYHSVGCVACHAPQAPAGEGGAEAVATLAEASVPLGDLARKTTVQELARFLQNPLQARPSGRMPSMNLTPGEAIAVATYLLRAQAESTGPQGPAVRVPGLQFEYFEKLMRDTGGIDSAVPTATGSIDQFSLSPKKRNEQIAFRFTGLLTLTRSNTYTFFVTADDGARLWIDGRLVVDNDGVHPPQEKSGNLDLGAGEHSIALSYFNEYAGGELSVAWQETGRPKRAIPAALLSHVGRSMIPLGAETLTLDPAKVARGRELFASLGCAACHRLGPGGEVPSSLKAPALASLDAAKPGGCLADPRSGVPAFGLSDEQRSALRGVVSSPASLAAPLDPGSLVTRRMTLLNCFACHSRDGIGGPVEARAEYFTTVDKADLGDEGRIPPHLNRVGDKLRADWIPKVLLQKAAVRPYMATRMPQFGAEAVGGLAEAIVKADATPETPAPEAGPTDAKFGRQLVGAGGLSCIACHRFGGHNSLGIPALDLTTVSERLRRDWFLKYLPDPAALRPGTRMPSFWPEGKAANREILGGETRRQLEAIWTFLSAGKGAKVPDGLIPTGIELVASQEPVIYRHFIEGAGSRAIGVGYPEKANLAFDANNLRLALLWHGRFIDAGKHRRDRGAGYEPPLGDDVIRLPEGPPFARLEGPARPWPGDAGKAAGYQMKGYRLDDRRRPIFLYTFDGIAVEDSFVAVPREPEPGFVRTLSLRSESVLPPLWFRAAVGESIELKGGAYVVDGHISLKFTLEGGARPQIRKMSGRYELLVPVSTTGQEAKIVEEILW